MTNEELCLLIQQGHEELIPELWEQCHDFISMMAGKYVEGLQQPDYTAKEDCIQEAYFGFLDAIRLYKEQEASFIHYLSYHIINRFKVACCGGVTKKKQMDPLNHATSIDAQMKIAGNTYTLAELIAEKQQGEQTEYVLQPDLVELEEADYWQSVNGFMHDAFDKSSDDLGGQLYHYMLDHDCSFRDAVIGLYGKDAFEDSRLMNRLRTGRRRTQSDFLRYWNSHKEERRKLALDDAVFQNGLRPYSLRRFRSSGSFVESAVIKLIDGQNDWSESG